jgi:ferric-dicitrate binding protein FerR (iron transport regulator)
VEDVEGDLNFRDNDVDWKSAVGGQEFLTITDVSTGPDSKAVIRFRDGSTITLSELTQMEIGDQSAKEDRPRLRMYLEKGEVAAKANGADFRIRTVFATARIRGTETGGTEFTVRSGDVIDNHPVDTFTVYRGSVLIFPIQMLPETREPLLLSAGQSVKASSGGDFDPIERAPNP